jgi:hypothetical protein
MTQAAVKHSATSGAGGARSLLGHRSPLTTARYAHLTERTAANTRERIEALMQSLQALWRAG